MAATMVPVILSLVLAASALRQVQEGHDVQVEEAQRELDVEKGNQSKQIDLEKNEYILTWINRYGNEAQERFLRRGEVVVVPVKCSKKAVWLNVGAETLKDRPVGRIDSHCMKVTCTAAGDVVAQNLDSCPWVGSPHSSSARGLPERIIDTHDFYVMKPGKNSRGRSAKSGESGFTAFAAGGEYPAGGATDAEQTERGWEVDVATMSHKYDFEFRWGLDYDCRRTMEDGDGLPVPVDGTSIQTCKTEAEAKKNRCKHQLTEEAAEQTGKSAWWWKFQYFSTRGNKYGSTWHDVCQKYPVCKKWSDDAHWSKYKDDKTLDMEMAKHSNFAVFGQSWQYKCEQALDNEIADAQKIERKCPSRSWWCDSAEVKTCALEFFLPSP